MTGKRGRPTQHKDDHARQIESLNDLETRAQERIKSDGRVSVRPKLKLEWAHKEEGYHYTWTSDGENYPVSLQQMLDGGYTFVRHGAGTRRGEPVVQHSKGVNLYLMRCPQKYFEEDQAKLHNKSIEAFKQVTAVGEREYAGDSKKMGAGNTVKMDYVESPDAINLMQE